MKYSLLTVFALCTVFGFCTGTGSPVVSNGRASVQAGRSDENPFHIRKLKGLVNWKSDQEEPKGNIILTAQIPISTDDLSFLDGVSIPSLVIITSDLGEAEFSPGIFSCNAKCTTARASIKEDGTRLVCKLKIKNRVLYVILRGKNGYNLPRGFGITDSSTDGWQKNTVSVEFILLYGGHAVLGSAEEDIRYSTKPGKKTKVK
jgi:hypothetical protein